MEEFSYFKTINSKLKKKFSIRKPDLNETSQQFHELSKELKLSKSHSGLCCLAAANCEHNLKNKNNEFETYIESGRIFKEANNSNAAIFSYQKALDICDVEKKCVYYLEFANFFEQQNRFIEAAKIYKEGGFLKKAALTYIRVKLFDQAYNCYTKIDQEQFEKNDYITFFFLKLILFDLKEDTFSFPIITSNTNNESIAEINILLESLVLLLLDKCQDRIIYLQLRSNLECYLIGIQKDLFYYLLKDILYPGIKN